jgi:hypothetical protein
MQVSQILSEIDGEIERLQQARNLLAGVVVRKAGRRATSATPKAAKKAKKKTGKKRLSAEGRRRISEALKARWAERRKRAAGKSSR